jgi:UDP-glucose 4-epimerase
MKWLITGGCGFVGTCLIRHLHAEGGHTVRIVDSLSTGSRDELDAICNFVERKPERLTPASFDHLTELIIGDILDEQLALKAAQGIDVIVHLAANTGVGSSVEDPRADCVTNVIGTLNYLEAARCNRVKRFVFASSGASIGEHEPPLHEDLAPRPVSPYGASKLAGEGYCSVYFHTFNVETVVLRFGNVYGPGSGHKNSVVAKFIRQAMSRETLEVYGNGRQTRDFIYIDDLIRAIQLAATVNGIGGEIFQIATNTETTVSELVTQLLSILADIGIDDVQVRLTNPRLGDVRRNFSDTSKARQQLGWETKVEFVDGLKRTVEWFVQKMKI